MQNTIALDAMNDRVIVHAMGAGYGEGIVLTVGGRLVLGFDCCDALVQPGSRGSSYLERVLSSCQPKAHVIWVLTHFHFDHFQSFTTLLEQIGTNLKKIVVPGDYTSADLAHLANEARSEAGVGEFYRAKDEYSRLKRRLESPALNQIVSTLSGPGALFGLDLRLPNGTTVPVAGELFGPNYRVRKINKITAINEFKDGKKKRTDANHTSYIARVRAGRFDSLFLGDAPAIRTVARGPHCNDAVSLFLLKVAHHGAADGTSTRLLSSVGDKAAKRVAMICPFTAHGLPKQSILDMLKEAGFQTMVSGSQKPSPRLKDLILSRTDLATNKTALKVYSHGSNARVVRSRL